MPSEYVQYGCGLSAPHEWDNYDASPTLRIQKNPLLKLIFKNKLNAVFPGNVKYGDIVKGLPVMENSCKGVYCSHTLEHLSLDDFRLSLKNTLGILQPGGIFRCVLPDLEMATRNYINELDKGNKEASIEYISNILMGLKSRPKGIKRIAESVFGNAHHLWMWDKYSLAAELEKAGFKNIRVCNFNDSEDAMFTHVEDRTRFYSAIALQCYK
jgi:ubiquinone/menaquinone biosynthesis C-methylase UbiE